MARLVIVAGPALLASPHFFLYSTPPFSTSPHTWPGLPLWQVPPSNQLPQPTSPPSYSPIIPIIKARLVIVAGPASLASSHFFLSITPPFFYILTHMAWLVIVAGLAFQPASPPSSSYLLPHHPHHSGPACHCGRSRQDPSSLSLHLHPSGFPFVICLARLTIVASPASSIFTTYPSPPPSTPFCSSPLEARLVIVAGPAWSSPSTSRPCLFSLSFSPLSPYSLSPLAAPRAPVAMGDPK